MYIPKKAPKKIKKIYVEYIESFGVPIGKKAFSHGFGSNFYATKKCPVDECEIVNYTKNADALIFTNHVTKKRDITVPYDQVKSASKIFKEVN